jgi:hypothetical protein
MDGEDWRRLVGGSHGGWWRWRKTNLALLVGFFELPHLFLLVIPS